MNNKHKLHHKTSSARGCFIFIGCMRLIYFPTLNGWFLLLGNLMWVNIPFVLDPTVMRPRSLLDMWNKSYLYPTNRGDWYGLLSSRSKNFTSRETASLLYGSVSLKTKQLDTFKLEILLVFLGILIYPGVWNIFPILTGQYFFIPFPRVVLVPIFPSKKKQKNTGGCPVADHFVEVLDPDGQAVGVMGIQGYPPQCHPPQEIRPYEGTINHWFPLIRPKIRAVFLGAVDFGGGYP